MRTAALMLLALLGGALVGPTCCTIAQVSADSGERIVFSSDRSGPWQLWTVRPDGSDLQQLTQGGENDNDVDPVFGPDGRQILFSSTRGGQVGVWRVDRDGSRPERICDGDQAEWSPDGARIVLRRNEQILVRELETGRERLLSPPDWPHCSGPAWSPDGAWIAFACRWDAGNAIFVTASEGGEPRKVYDRKGACEPHWSPDSTRLVYETETQICTIQPDGNKNRIVTFFGGVQRYGRYSPDAQWIIFCQGSSERGPWELYKIPALGGSPVQLTRDGSDMQPDWK
jgi:Tol biopolymer transport system component